MTYQITVKRLGAIDKVYEGIESIDAVNAIDRIIKQYYDYIEYNGALIVIGYDFTARRLGMWLS